MTCEPAAGPPRTVSGDALFELTYGAGTYSPYEDIVREAAAQPASRLVADTCCTMDELPHGPKPPRAGRWT